MRRGKTGIPTGSVVYSPGRLKAMRAAARRTERRWAAMAGPVSVRRIEPEESEDGGTDAEQ